MGLFSTKCCDICGGKIGLLGNKKLEDGSMCKDCERKLSPWFIERRESTQSEIKLQLSYREANKERLSAFHPTRKLGMDKMLMIDEEAGRFTVATEGDLLEANPDILNLSDVTSCNLDIDEKRVELMKEDSEGREVSYIPSRYEYSYNFNMNIKVKNPYFDFMKFKLNNYSVDGQSRLEFEKYKDMGEEMCAALNK